MAGLAKYESLLSMVLMTPMDRGMGEREYLGTQPHIQTYLYLLCDMPGKGCKTNDLKNYSSPLIPAYAVYTV